MTFVANGSLGHTSSKSAGSTLSLSPSRAVPFGNMIVVWASWIGDRNYTDAAGLMDDGLSCTDSEGNIYTTLGGALYDVSNWIFLAYVTHPLTTSSTITLRHRTAALDARAMSVEDFTIPLNQRPAFWRDRANAIEYFQGGTLGGISNSGLSSSIEYLLLHGLTNNRPSTDSYSYDSDYTPIASDGTTGGGATSNVGLIGGYRVVSGITGDSVSVSDSTAATTNDSWQNLVALSLVDFDDNFPTFPDLDDFNRADQELGLPKWKDPADSGPGFQTDRIRIVSHEAARSTLHTGSGAQFWATPIPAGDDGEVGVRISTVGAARHIVQMFASGDGEHADLAGYALSWLRLGSDPREDLIQWGESGNTGSVGSRFVNTWTPLVARNQFGLQMRESGVILHLWVDQTGNDEWEWVAANYKTAFVSNGGLAGLDFNGDAVARMDDFFAGTSIRFVPQIIRRPPDPDGAREPPP